MTATFHGFDLNVEIIKPLSNDEYQKSRMDIKELKIRENIEEETCDLIITNWEGKETIFLWDDVLFLSDFCMILNKEEVE